MAANKLIYQYAVRYDNYTRQGPTVAAGSLVSGYSNAWLYDGNPQRVVLYEADGSGLIRIVIDLGFVGQMTLASLINFAPAAGHSVSSVTLQANSSNSWGSPAQSMAFTLISPADFEGYRLNPWIRTDLTWSSSNYRYWSFAIQMGAASQRVQIGQLWLGPARILTNNYAFGFKTRVVRPGTMKHTTGGGLDWTYPGLSRDRMLEGSVESASYSELLDWNHNCLGTSLPCLIIPDQTKNDAWMVKWLDTYEDENIFVERRVPIRFAEVARGIPLSTSFAT